MKRAALVAILLIPSVAGGARAEEPAGTIVTSRFSGKPVPRFETLRWAEVNGRVGPSLSYPIAWRYNRKGLPVLIVKESGEWRRVRDPAGDEVWVHGRMLEAGNTAMVIQAEVMRAGPDPQAQAIAEIGRDVVVSLDECRETHCRVRAGDYRGWIARNQLWGIDTEPKAAEATRS